MELRGLSVVQEAPVTVFYKETEVGEYRADLLVNNSVLVELKVAEAYRTADEAQLLNQLKAFQLRVGLLVNFGKRKAEFKRLAF